ncbi:hypothetical protein A2U01_0102110, partial [Trifolium medium]|nr:hypothetical protein [Trifolium medium]
SGFEGQSSRGSGNSQIQFMIKL